MLKFVEQCYHLQTVVDADQIAVIFGSRHMIDILKDTSGIQFDGKLKVLSFINFLQYSLTYTLKDILFLGCTF